MPTENRSSNTEMVSVPREAVVQAAELLQEYNKCSIARDLRAILAQPAVQHQGEPMALPARKDPTEAWAIPGGVHKAEGWNACLDEIAKLGRLYSRPVQGEPVARVEVGPDRNACLAITDNDWLRALKGRAMHQVVPLYAHADPGEVERLRADAVTQKAIADEAWAEVEKCRENSRIITQQVDTLRAQLAEGQALLREIHDGALSGFARYSKIEEFLSASAEPSAPAVSNLPELTDDLREILGRPNFTCHFIAKALRIMGHSIAPKSEDEQAVVIHWLLGHYLKDGSDWRLRAEAELKAASVKLAPSAAPQQ